MKIEDIKGVHRLSGVDYGWGKRIIDGITIRFCIDGVTYVARENPDDGYRSYMEELEISGEPCRNTFPAEEVFCEREYESSGESKDILLIKNIHTTEEILRVGTDYTDSYYPYCVMEYHPENLKCNMDRR